MATKPETITTHSRKIILANESVALPIYQTSNYRFESVQALEHYLEGDDSLYLYSRYENPTLRAVQEKIAELEKGDCCYVFSSGMAAITSSIFAFIKAGDEVLASDSLYGRTQLFIENWLPRLGIKTRFIPVKEFPDIDRYFTDQTRILYIESPTNPVLGIIDIEAAAAVAHKHGCVLLIDNTFASPINQNPITMGADVVLHSATKYMGGHSDIIAGASIFARENEKRMRDSIRTLGGTMDPLAAFLLERGLKTLAVRVERQNHTTSMLAQRLVEQGKVKKVNYPGLTTHPQHAVAAKQMRGFGGMFSFDLDSYEAASRFIDKLKIIVHAGSLGGVESLATLPVLTSHYGQPPKNLEAAGISPATVRMSIGLEDPEDLWSDIQQALG